MKFVGALAFFLWLGETHAGSIVGRIQEYCGQKPITLVDKIELKIGEAIVQQTGVDANGFFRFLEVLPGKYVIEIRKDKYVYCPTRKEAEIKEGNPQDDVGVIALYSQGCLASLKPDDLNKFVSQLVVEKGGNVEDLLVNLKLVRTAVDYGTVQMLSLNLDLSEVPREIRRQAGFHDIIVYNPKRDDDPN